eukprot:TRINITY_DN19789_c0_g1_i1.p1 TRINITY_DN19789_c0_g1~~TRINITY_DN19789_c0_g1_i1.p1  ORF type:complete len:543 (+),score=85.30 TRINITY_DN19789_c0_g1_i1:196-1824(+)
MLLRNFAAAAAAALLWGFPRPSLGLQLGVVSMDGLEQAMADSGVGTRCREKVVKDWEAARRLENVPLNGYDLADECRDGGSEVDEGSGVVIFVLAHEACGANGLVRLLRRLAHEKIFLVVGFDKSGGVEETLCLREIETRYKNDENFAFVTTIDVEWGDTGMLETEWEAMKIAVKRWTGWTHFISISGSDYPLVTPDEIVTFFKGLVGLSYYYENQVAEETKTLWMSELVSTCDMKLHHIGWRQTPPLSFFVTSNFNKFFSRSFIEYLTMGRDLNFTPLFQLLATTLSADEIFFQTLHKKSPYCTRLANINPREFSTSYWPGDSKSRLCDPGEIHGKTDAPQWYCPKRPFYLSGRADWERLSSSPSIFVRKLSRDEAAFKDWADNRWGYCPDTTPKYHLTSSKGSLVLETQPPPEGNTELDAILTWHWAVGGNGTLFTLTDCTESMCRIRAAPFDAPPLCVAYHVPRIHTTLTFAECANPFAEPFLWSPDTPVLSSMSKVSLVQYNATKGLCVGAGVKPSQPLVLQPCDAVTDGVRLVKVKD